MPANVAGSSITTVSGLHQAAQGDATARFVLHASCPERPSREELIRSYSMVAILRVLRLGEKPKGQSGFGCATWQFWPPKGA